MNWTEEDFARFNQRAGRQQPAPPKKSKLRNQPVTVDGIRFHSKREANRYCQLKIMEKAGAISGLHLQVEYILAPSVEINGRKKPPLRYFADFVYMEHGVKVVEDAKGHRTDVYKIKRHLVKHIHGVDIREI